VPGRHALGGLLHQQNDVLLRRDVERVGVVHAGANLFTNGREIKDSDR
jgi:hypothetical protein